jgi:cation diffusion facilitator CzcD-associated flavoprotein CzcO
MTETADTTDTDTEAAGSAASAAPAAGSPGAVEHLDVVVVGAGLSGIGAGHHLQAECPWAGYAILEARDAIGGTWDLFRYPGVRSDSDMFTLGYAFRPWDQDASIADGASILRYIRETAAAEGIDRKIRFRHRVERAAWSSADARWHLTVRRPAEGDGGDELVEMTCGFLFSCSGYYRYDRGHEPELPRVDRFGGTIVHPQFWPEDLDYAGRRIVVIGSGATAVTLVPSLARTAEHVTMLQRSPTYVTSLPEKDALANLVRRRLPARVSGPLVRWYKALTTQAFFQVSQRRPELVKRLLREGAKRQLPDGYDVDTHFAPTYNPWDQRLCLVPNGDLFRAIRDGSASVATDTIDTFTETGVRLSSGTELPADIVVTATGLELLFLGGIALEVDGEAVDVPSTLAYKGMMLEGVPNLAMAVGYTNASWTLKCDLTCQYVARLLNHLRATGLRQCTPVNDDPTVTSKPLLGLTSGYVLRSQDRFPKQGSKFPWQVHQSYLKDYRALRLRGIEDEAMRFTNPTPRAGRVVATAAS